MKYFKSLSSLQLVMFLFLSSSPAFAEQDYLFSAQTLTGFFFGISLPLFILFIWRLVNNTFKDKPPLSALVTLTQDEVFNYTHDITTNLPTAQHALKMFEKALKVDVNKKLAAIVFKPVNFQQVNAVLGHHNSDILLLQLAYCLKTATAANHHLLNFDSSSDPVKLARLQGLDFLVVFDLSTSTHDAKSVIDNLCHQLTKAVPDAMSFKSFSLNFDLAFGVSISGENGHNVNEIVSHATDALLEAEANNKIIQYFDNKSVLYTEKQLALMDQLRQDILAQNLHWYVQPQVNVSNNKIVGFALKVHWYKNDEAPLELVDFISLAEHSGEVYSLTKQMFKQAFNILSTLHKLGIHQKVSVSLFSKNLLEPDLVDFIEQQLNSYNISGKYLMIELNEQVMLSACQRAKNTIDQLKSLDLTIAISDFSGSYESLRYLRKMAIHQVKINCQKLGERDGNRADSAILNALITLTRSMKIPLVGTHIDKSETVNAYIAIGGSLAQGNVINKGVVPDELEIWLKRWFSQHPESKSDNDAS